MLQSLLRSFQFQVNKSAKSLNRFTLETLREYLEACLKEHKKLSKEDRKNLIIK